MISIEDTDKRMAVLNMVNSETFDLLTRAHDEHVDRLTQKLLDPKTSQSDTIILKGVVNEAKKLDPRSLCRLIVSRIESRMEKGGTGVVVIKK